MGGRGGQNQAASRWPALRSGPRGRSHGIRHNIAATAVYVAFRCVLLGWGSALRRTLVELRAHLSGCCLEGPKIGLSPQTYPRLRIYACASAPSEPTALAAWDPASHCQAMEAVHPKAGEVSSLLRLEPDPLGLRTSGVSEALLAQAMLVPGPKCAPMPPMLREATSVVGGASDPRRIVMATACVLFSGPASA